MNSDITYIDSYAGLAECKINNSRLSTSLMQSSTVVNPSYGSLSNKTIIINLPLKIPISQLDKFNNIISRYPIGSGIKVKEYELPDEMEDIVIDDYSCLILNKYMLNNLKHISLVDNTKFLVGLDESINDSLTLVGYLLLRTNLNKFR